MLWLSLNRPVHQWEAKWRRTKSREKSLQREVKEDRWAKEKKDKLKKEGEKEKHSFQVLLPLLSARHGPLPVRGRCFGRHSMTARMTNEWSVGITCHQIDVAVLFREHGSFQKMGQTKLPSSSPFPLFPYPYFPFPPLPTSLYFPFLEVGSLKSSYSLKAV